METRASGRCLQQAAGNETMVLCLAEVGRAAGRFELGAVTVLADH
jgi:hypothetical protein